MGIDLSMKLVGSSASAITRALEHVQPGDASSLSRAGQQLHDGGKGIAFNLARLVKAEPGAHLDINELGPHVAEILGAAGELSAPNAGVLQGQRAVGSVGSSLNVIVDHLGAIKATRVDLPAPTAGDIAGQLRIDSDAAILRQHLGVNGEGTYPRAHLEALAMPMWDVLLGKAALGAPDGELLSIADNLAATIGAARQLKLTEAHGSSLYTTATHDAHAAANRATATLTAATDEIEIMAGIRAAAPVSNADPVAAIAGRIADITHDFDPLVGVRWPGR